MIKIGLFSLKENVGCTAMSIHIANYFAGVEGKTVALVEPKKKGILLNTYEESLYASVDADYEFDGTFVLNNVRYYPAKRRGPWIYDSYDLVEGEERMPDEDIVIYDFGKVGFLHEFEESFDKLYLCTDGASLTDEVSFAKDTKCNPEVILFGASKDVLNEYQRYGFKCVLVGNKKEERLPKNFASNLEIFCRLNQIIPPEYHKDWTYAPVVFDYKPDPKPEEKQSFFGKMFGKKKKKEEKAKKESVTVEVPKQVNPEESGVGVAKTVDARDAMVYEEYNFVNVPAPEDFIDEEPAPEEPEVEESEAKEAKTEVSVVEVPVLEIPVPEEPVQEEEPEESKPEVDQSELIKSIIAEERSRSFDLVERAKNKAKADFDNKLQQQKHQTDELIAENKKALEAKDAALRNKEAEMAALKEQADKEKEFNEEELAKKESEINSIKEQAKRNLHEIKRELLEKEAELAALKQKSLDDSKAKDDALKAKQDEIDALKALNSNNSDIKEKLTEKENELNNLKAQLNNETAAKDKALSDKEAEIRTIREQVNQANQEKNNLLREKEAEINAIKDQIAQKERSVNEKIREHELEINSIKEENQKLEAEADSLREEQEKIEAENKKLAEQARLEKERADKLLYEATHDELTGLLNTRAFNSAVEEFDVSRGALIFIDVNDLKKTNDTISHEAGDKLLTTVSDQLTRHFKDETYRIGGDEFIILTSDDENQIDKKINSITKALATFTKRDKKITYSVSYGVAYCDGVKDIFALKSEADAKMYEFKKQHKINNAPAEEPAVVTKEKDRKRQMAGSQVKGLLGKVITYILKDEANVCNMYIVTKDKRLIIFDDPNAFFNKLELLKREIRDMDRVHYIIVSHIDESAPKVITDDYTLEDPFMLLEALDSDLRISHLSDDDIRRHKELILFDEILVA